MKKRVTLLDSRCTAKVIGKRDPNRSPLSPNILSITVLTLLPTAEYTDFPLTESESLEISLFTAIGVVKKSNL